MGGLLGGESSVGSEVFLAFRGEGEGERFRGRFGGSLRVCLVPLVPRRCLAAVSVSVSDS